MTAMRRPQLPGMRPLGIGRLGSLMASTWRSNQSFTAWLVAQTIGPARMTPINASHQRSPKGTPDATTPQAKAHIGGNQVIGLNSSATAGHSGKVRAAGETASTVGVTALRSMPEILHLTLTSVNQN